MNGNIETKNIDRNGIQILIDGYLVIMLLGGPLYMHNAYFDILETKYLYFVVCTGIFMGLLFIGGIVTGKLGCIVKKEFLKKVLNSLNTGDKAVIALGVIAGLSTLLSDYKYESFWGNEGRFCGFFFLMLCIILYFTISKLWKYEDWIIDVFIISLIIVALLGILDYFQIDLFQWKVHIASLPRNFTSTIGNINTYTAILSFGCGLTIIKFITEDRTIKCLYYYLVAGIMFIGLITGRSDNAYVSTFAILVGIPLMVIDRKRDAARYFAVITGFFVCVHVITYVEKAFSGKTYTILGLFNVISGIETKFKLMYLCLALTIIYYYWIIKEKKSTEKLPGYVKKVYGLLIIMVFAIVCGILIDANVLGNEQRYERIKGFVVFDEGWGSSRGLIWSMSMEGYKLFSPVHKIFGYGMETTGIVNKLYFSNISRLNREIYDSPHNEYLQLFLSVGPIGLIAYLTMLVSNCKDMIKRASSKKYGYALVAAIIGYAFQQSVNIVVPITVPYLWILIAMGKARSGANCIDIRRTRTE